MPTREVGENRKRIRHMCSVPTLSAGVAAIGDSKVGGGGGSCSTFSSCKDVRKINVGDCALFEPRQGSPPFIGIIRSLGSEKENILGVNWLYRPADVKLVKGAALEAAPNEVFYSFNSDEISAGLLLHPCKVAFLPKGVELPPGISSFVCRRVYDTKNIYQEFINDQQEEVDQLLRKTQTEMHATVQQQQGGRSPKPGSSPMSASQLKQSPDSVQNSATNFPAHQKGKKRERSDQVLESVKRERTLRTDDGDFGFQSMLKSEIAKITDKGGLVDSEGVERLIQLMHPPDKSERRLDLTCRSLLTGVVAVTDKVDLLNRFVQLRGLPVLDEWLQDVHKGKVGDSSSPRDHDRTVEDFLLVLLRALDRLPVNLNALQTCNIGKSVNHLRSHRNAEIQKKARTLVDTWKKRVELEMNINDAKSVSGQAVAWTARTRHEVSHGGNRHAGVSSDTTTKNSVSQVSLKSTSVKMVAGEAVGKAAIGLASPGIVKLVSSPGSVSTNTRDGHLRTSVISSNSELPQSATRDDKSSSSSQSHTNSQCSSDHAKNLGFSGKEDTRSSNSGSTSLNKSSGGVSRQRKSANGLQSLAASAVQKDSLARVSAAEKLSQSPATCEKIVDAPVSDSNNHKIIVKISNRGRSPAQSINGVSIEDPSLINSRASSPVHSEKHGQSDHSSKDRNDGCRNGTVADTNDESWQSNDLKDGATGCDEGSGSPAAAPDFGRFQRGDETGKLAEVMKVVGPSKSEMKPKKLLDSSLSSINALIESCVKYSEGNASMSSTGDDGMNLLASVAAGEISKSNGASPTHSPQGSASVADETIRSKLYGDGDISGESCLDQKQSNDDMYVEAQKQKIGSGALHGNEDPVDHMVIPGKDVLHDVEASLESDGKINEPGVNASVLPVPTCAARAEAGQVHESKAGVKDGGHVYVPDRALDDTEDKETDFKDQSLLKATETVSLPAVQDKNDVKVEPKGKTSLERPPAIMTSESGTRNKKCTVSSCIVNNLLPGQLNDLKEEDVDTGCDTLVKQEANKTLEAEVTHTDPPKQEESVLETGLTDQKTKGEEGNANKQVAAGSSNIINSPATADVEKELCSHVEGSKLAVGEVIEEPASVAGDATSSGAGCSAADGRLEFDLNEGLNVDDSKDDDPSVAGALGCPPSFNSSTLLPCLSVASASLSVPTLVTVAAAAKGPFVPPEDLLRNKGEFGWKGSAVTSAFRPAEPRKVFELPLSNNNVTPDTSARKEGRGLLEIDLNVADESILEDMGLNPDIKQEKRNNCDASQSAASSRSVGGLDLDLNRVEEAPESAQPPSSSHISEARFQSAKMYSSSGLSNSEGGRKDFDLNNGPVADEAAVDSSSYHLHGRPNIPLQPSIGFRINSTEVGNLNSWYATGNSFSAIPVPPQLADREQPFPIVGTSGGPPRILGAPMGTMPFNPEIYRGSVLQSSPAVTFPGAPFQYPVFPFGTSYPLPSSSLPGGSTAFVDLSSGGRICIPAVPSQLIGSAPAVCSQYPRPYVVNLSDVSNSVAVENHRKLRRQGLDLNAGPGGPDVEGRDETLPIPPRPVSTIGSLALTDEQSRIYPMAGGVLKRKEPEGGWDTDRFSGYKQPSWQ